MTIGVNLVGVAQYVAQFFVLKESLDYDCIINRLDRIGQMLNKIKIFLLRCETHSFLYQK